MDLPIVGHRDVAVATVAGYLGRPFYYPSVGRETDFIALNTLDWFNIDDAEVLSQAKILSKERDRDVLIVSHPRLIQGLLYYLPEANDVTDPARASSFSPPVRPLPRPQRTPSGGLAPVWSSPEYLPSLLCKTSSPSGQHVS